MSFSYPALPVPVFLIYRPTPAIRPAPCKARHKNSNHFAAQYPDGSNPISQNKGESWFVRLLRVSEDAKF